MIPFTYISAHPTGSRYTVSPAVIDTDDDWLILVEDLAATAKEMAARPDWVTPIDVDLIGYQLEEGKWAFVSYRMGDKNLIVTDDRAMYLRSVAATLLAAKLNLQSKDDRIELFRAIKFGGDYKGRLP